MFFFSSRRRHTRYWRDWSSDVCSSDLAAPGRSRDHLRRDVVLLGEQRHALAPEGGDDAGAQVPADVELLAGQRAGDRKSTRLNSSHANISYAVFCLKKNKNAYAVITLT